MTNEVEDEKKFRKAFLYRPITTEMLKGSKKHKENGLVWEEHLFRDGGVEEALLDGWQEDRTIPEKKDTPEKKEIPVAETVVSKKESPAPENIIEPKKKGRPFGSKEAEEKAKAKKAKATSNIPYPVGVKSPEA